MLYMIIGASRAGKTDTAFRIAANLRTRGYNVGGFITLQDSQGTNRIVLDLTNDRFAWLYWWDGIPTINVRDLGVKINYDALDELAAKSVIDALKVSDVIICDEMGHRDGKDKILQTCTKFRNAMLTVAREAGLGKPVIATSVRDSPILEEIDIDHKYYLVPANQTAIIDSIITSVLAELG